MSHSRFNKLVSDEHTLRGEACDSKEPCCTPKQSKCVRIKAVAPGRPADRTQLARHVLDAPIPSMWWWLPLFGKLHRYHGIPELQCQGRTSVVVAYLSDEMQGNGSGNALLIGDIHALAMFDSIADGFRADYESLILLAAQGDLQLHWKA